MIDHIKYPMLARSLELQERAASVLQALKKNFKSREFKREWKKLEKDNADLFKRFKKKSAESYEDFLN